MSKLYDLSTWSSDDILNFDISFISEAQFQWQYSSSRFSLFLNNNIISDDYYDIIQMNSGNVRFALSVNQQFKSMISVDDEIKVNVSYNQYDDNNSYYLSGWEYKEDEEQIIPEVVELNFNDPRLQDNWEQNIFVGINDDVSLPSTSYVIYYNDYKVLIDGSIFVDNPQYELNDGDVVGVWFRNIPVVVDTCKIVDLTNYRDDLEGSYGFENKNKSKQPQDDLVNSLNWSDRLEEYDRSIGEIGFSELKQKADLGTYDAGTTWNALVEPRRYKNFSFHITDDQNQDIEGFKYECSIVDITDIENEVFVENIISNIDSSVVSISGKLLCGHSYKLTITNWPKDYLPYTTSPEVTISIDGIISCSGFIFYNNRYNYQVEELDLFSYAKYNSTNHQLIFFKSDQEYENGQIMGDTQYFTGILDTDPQNIPWKNIIGNVEQVLFLDNIRPRSTSFWFYGGENIVSVSEISKLNTSLVTNMSYMFSACYLITSLDLSGFNTSKVYNMSSMFSNCINLNGLIVLGWDTSKVQFMEAMFYNCRSIQSLDLSSFSVEMLEYTRDMFSGCSDLREIYASSNWSDSNTISRSQFMFHGCSKLNNWNAEYTDKTLAHYRPERTETHYISGYPKPAESTYEEVKDNYGRGSDYSYFYGVNDDKYCILARYWRVTERTETNNSTIFQWDDKNLTWVAAASRSYYEASSGHESDTPYPDQIWYDVESSLRLQNSSYSDLPDELGGDTITVILPAGYFTERTN